MAALLTFRILALQLLSSVLWNFGGEVASRDTLQSGIRIALSP